MASTGSGSKAGQVRTGRRARWRSPAAALAAGAVIVWILVPPPPTRRRLPGRRCRPSSPGNVLPPRWLLHTAYWIQHDPAYAGQRGDWSRTRQHSGGLSMVSTASVSAASVFTQHLNPLNTIFGSTLVALLPLA